MIGLLLFDGAGDEPLRGVTARALAALVTAFVAMLIVMPSLIAWLKRMKLGEGGAKNEGAQLIDLMREQKKGTPTMGGLGLVACVVITALLWCDPREWRTWLLLGGMLGFAWLGFLDDRVKVFKDSRGISERLKLSLQIALAGACGLGLYLIQAHDASLLLKDPDHTVYPKVLAGVEYTVRLGVHQVAIPLIPVEHALSLGAWFIAWSAFVTIACANGVNFTDGLDGLAAGTVFIAALAFAIIAYLVSRVDTADHLHVLYVSGGQEVTVLLAAVAGASLGFLWFNAAPALVFMGDTGSQALGAVIGLAALNTKQEFLILLVGFIFVAEAASVAIQKGVFKATKHRPGGGVRVFRCAPIHHHFQHLGWPESRVVLRFWIVAALMALVAVATLKLG